jgi:cytochrome c biogenesis protein CcmG, thiol:disulfide interchange protein DsbE
MNAQPLARSAARWPLGRPLGILVLLIGVAAAVFLATRPLGSTALPAEAEGFYAVGSIREGLQIGDRAPALSAVVGGQPVDLEQATGDRLDPAGLDGQAVWLVFGATWCDPCREEAPAIQVAHERHAARELRIVSVNVHQRVEEVSSFARDAHLTYPMMLDRTGAIAQRFGVYGYPTHYFIDRDGVVRARYLGPLAAAEIEERVAVILAQRGP